MPNGEWTSTVPEKLERSPVLVASFSHDGERVAATPLHGQTRIWHEISRGRWSDSVLLSRFDGPQYIWSSPDDTHLIVTDYYGPRLWQKWMTDHGKLSIYWLMSLELETAPQHGFHLMVVGS